MSTENKLVRVLPKIEDLVKADHYEDSADAFLV